MRAQPLAAASRASSSVDDVDGARRRAARSPRRAARPAGGRARRRPRRRPPSSGDRDLALLAAGDAAHQRGHAVGEIARTDLEPHGHALELPVGGAPAHRDVGRASSCARTPAARSSSVIARATRDDVALVAHHEHDDLMGARRGGTRRPSSSPCAMISPPTMRVDTPHDVVHAVCCAPVSSRNSMPNARAKFCPSSWLVPICSALPSPIIPSHVNVAVGAGEPLARGLDARRRRASRARRP